MRLIRYRPAAPLDTCVECFWWSRRDEPEASYEYMLRQHHGHSAPSGYSPRHFIALFRSAIGLAPKHYFRIKRFTAVLQRLASGNTETLADVAASAGYLGPVSSDRNSATWPASAHAISARGG